MFEIKVLRAGSVIIFRVEKFIKSSTHVIKKKKKNFYEFSFIHHFLEKSVKNQKVFKHSIQKYVITGDDNAKLRLNTFKSDFNSFHFFFYDCLNIVELSYAHSRR